MSRIQHAAIIFTVLAIFTILSSVAIASLPGRNAEPLVIDGASLPTLLGQQSSLITGFRYDGSWIQIPIQVDEKVTVDFGDIYNSDPSGFTVLTYADISTFTGPDTDPLFDSDDEIVFLSTGSGQRYTGTEAPAGVDPHTGVEVLLVDLLSLDSAYVYLFATDEGLDPAAEAPDIDYDFTLLSGDYKTSYNTMSGPNPENSTVVSPYYSVHFQDRWIRDETAIFHDGATGVDILDRHKNLFGPGNCGRSEDTFSAGEGAFIVNKCGPVRSIRGYVGANSGPTTHRIHFFYERREDILTILRVHAIPGIMGYFDYSPASTGMTYYNDLNTGGVTIDGAPEMVAVGQITWEMVTGTQGTLAYATTIETDIPDLSWTNYYSDDSTPEVTQCTGDVYEYGASGIWVDEEIPNTDPGAGGGSSYRFKTIRSIAFGGPALTTSFATDHYEDVTNPLTFSATPFTHLTDSGENPVTAGLNRFISIQATPNPSDGRITIKLALTRRGRIDISMYDVAGRKISHVSAREYQSGLHELHHDLSRIPSGIYFIRASGPAGSAASTRIILIK